ncbi:MAG: SulP family inorganic anion transporter [Pseudodesulfovibrio sp.]|uniref:Sulfate transporter n=1 Tax=Pseudodesulfovibrio aespoeensis (strain ATCC 700646 / DSM 10631 / Aspo-2) TaxID=643562 RepID=E6VUF1_PSEA9|nr:MULTISPECIES: SulP family inorganic anion transporter [Pseudodesulfovibrio]MBU4193112.1 SulP family inorganic anion transporter [Pseudomonadota bacterium]ADU61096.1 sulfate transporter [Pseudodesulfovibrio aespoeensis Aspo-2]MBU4244114.1 SulP family inorganic anion transporter [Pseudomonadota bacterium]MBU4377852.1 SulP family inorganic anion transporter [Pseudomonadota bacterium]MBU4476475.1 SulP family inorganic anion transporter [Pseudomonadota bacterium]
MVTKIFPFIDWFKGYSVTALRADAIAGLTVALVLIPQSMAYAQLAGMPAYYGLYAAFLPPMVAALFGSSRQLATGPVAVVSLMTAASLEPLATAGSEGYIAYAILLALMVGMFQFLLGVLRLGLVVNFLSHPVVNGFTNAAAIIIASSQLSKMFGVSVDKAEHHYETIVRVVESAVHYTHWPTLLMGALAFGIMISLKRINPKIPNVLVAVAVTTLLSWGLGFNHDAKTPIDAVRAPEVRQEAARFNTVLAEIETLNVERAGLNTALDEAKTAGNTIGVLDVEHDLNVINVRIARLKHEAETLRSGLRNALFDGVETGNGLVYYLQGQTPDGATTDGRTWRIKVGNSRLNDAGLTLMGGGEVVGSVPSGIPAISAPSLDLKVMLQLLPFAAIISLLGFMEAISIAKAMAAKTGQRLDPNQELIGQGLANMLGACGKSYPASGSFSRSAVNLQAGAMTGLSSVFTSLMVVIVLLFFTPLLYHLPQAVLAAVIMMAVIGLINAAGFVHAWKAQWYDGAISIISFACTLAFAPHLDKGIMVGVGLSLAVFLYKSMRPRVASLSRSEDEALRCAEEHGLAECEHVAVVRFDGPLFFANASFLEDKITERMAKNDKLRHIILVANGINDMDASGEEALSLLIDRVRSAGVDISLSGVNESVMAVLVRTHLLEKIGKDHLYTTMEAALHEVLEQAHQGAEEKACPLTTVCRLA